MKKYSFWIFGVLALTGASSIQSRAQEQPCYFECRGQIEFTVGVCGAASGAVELDPRPCAGAMYFGELDRNGLASGFGMHTAPNGVNWRGEYLENRLNGYGVAITKPSTEWPHERRHYYQFQSNSKIAEVIYNPGMGDVFPELEEWPWLVYVGGGFTRCRGSALAPTKCGWDEPSETVVNENQIRSIVEAARVAQNKGESAAAAAGQ